MQELSSAYAKFIERAKARGPWKIDGNGWIRNEVHHCPLQAVFGGSDYYFEAGESGMPSIESRTIANAADGYQSTPGGVAMRNRLIMDLNIETRERR